MKSICIVSFMQKKWKNQKLFKVLFLAVNFDLHIHITNLKENILLKTYYN